MRHRLGKSSNVAPPPMSLRYASRTDRAVAPRRRLPAYLALLAVVLACADPAQAQTPPGRLTVSGTVTDTRSGQPLPGATVTAWRGLSAVATATADGNGRYEMVVAAPTTAEQAPAPSPAPSG